MKDRREAEEGTQAETLKYSKSKMRGTVGENQHSHVQMGGNEVTEEGKVFCCAGTVSFGVHHCGDYKCLPAVMHATRLLFGDCCLHSCPPLAGTVST